MPNQSHYIGFIVRVHPSNAATIKDALVQFISKAEQADQFYIYSPHLTRMPKNIGAAVQAVGMARTDIDLDNATSGVLASIDEAEYGRKYTTIIITDSLCTCDASPLRKAIAKTQGMSLILLTFAPTEEKDALAMNNELNIVSLNSKAELIKYLMDYYHG